MANDENKREELTQEEIKMLRREVTEVHEATRRATTKQVERGIRARQEEREQINYRERRVDRREREENPLTQQWNHGEEAHRHQYMISGRRSGKTTEYRRLRLEQLTEQLEIERAKQGSDRDPELINDLQGMVNTAEEQIRWQVEYATQMKQREQYRNLDMKEIRQLLDSLLSYLGLEIYKTKAANDRYSTAISDGQHDTEILAVRPIPTEYKEETTRFDDMIIDEEMNNGKKKVKSAAGRIRRKRRVSRKR